MQRSTLHNTSARKRASESIPPSPLPVHSANSGSYDPGPVGNEDGSSPELPTVLAARNDLQLEEFPEGPYGAARSQPASGRQRSQKGKASVSAHRDQNPISSDRKRAAHEPEFDAPPGTEEGQN